jgi:prevent-host-death family protein
LRCATPKPPSPPLVDAAEKGEPTVISKHGRPAAMLVPIDMGRRFSGAERPGFAEFLLSVPTGAEGGRDGTPLRPVDF